MVSVLLVNTSAYQDHKEARALQSGMLADLRVCIASNDTQIRQWVGMKCRQCQNDNLSAMQSSVNLT